MNKASKDTFKILIVDSNQTFVDILNTYLVNLKLIVMYAYTGNDAKLLIEVQKPNLVVTEVDLPDINGIEFLHWVNKKHSKIKTILMANNTNIIDHKESLELGAFDFLIKPFPTEEFDRILKRLIPEFLSKKESEKQ